MSKDSEDITKFSWVRMTEAEEKRLRKAFDDHREKVDASIKSKGCGYLSHPDIQERIEKMDKVDRAHDVFWLSQWYTIPILCDAHHISQGYFRDLRIRNRQKWEQEKKDFYDDDFRYMIEEANNPKVTRNEWIEGYDEGDREQFKTGLLSVVVD